MKTSKDVKAFKNELRNYMYFKTRYDKAKEMRDWCYDQLGASARSPQFDSEPIHSPKNIDREYKIREEIENWEAKMAKAKLRITEVEIILDKMECISGKLARDLAFKMYALGQTSEKLSHQVGYSRSGVKQIIDLAIKKALED